MSSTFPNMIPSEPPPLDLMDDEEDEEDMDGGYASNGLKLDILGEVSPMSSPQRKLPISKNCTPERINPITNGISSYGEMEEGIITTSEDVITVSTTNLNDSDRDLVKSSDSEANSFIEDPVSVQNSNSPGPNDDFHPPRSSERVITPEEHSNSNHTEDLDLAPPFDSPKPDQSSDSFEEADNFGEFLSPEIVPPENNLTDKCITPEEVQTVEANESFSDRTQTSDFEPVVIETPNVLEDICADSTASPPPHIDNKEDLIGHVQMDNIIPDVTTPNSSTTIDDEDDDDFGDFSNAFATKGPENSSSVSLSPLKLANSTPLVTPSDDAMNVFEPRPLPTNLDSLESFSSELVLPQAESDDDDDFGDFHCSNKSQTGTLRPSIPEPRRATVPLPLKTSFVGIASPEPSPPPVSVSSPIAFSQPLTTTGGMKSKSNFPTTSSTLRRQSSSTSGAGASSFDEDFGDFLTSDHNEQTPHPERFTRRDSQLESRFETLVTSVFEKPNTVQPTSQTLRPVDKELETKTNPSWAHVQEFEDSHGLKFKWPNSTAYQNLLQSLKIDTSIVLYSGKWGTIEIPKFAASLAQIPLQPLASAGVSSSGLSAANVGRAAVVSEAEADSWDSSDFQEFQSYKTIGSSVGKVNNPDENHYKNHHTPSLQQSLKSTKDSLTSFTTMTTMTTAQRQMTSSSTLPPYTPPRTEELLVFPDSPMFQE